MGKNKLKRFEDIARFEHVLELTDFQEQPDLKPRGRWNEEVFANNRPITLELACGKGEYTLALAERYPDRNFIGIDIKGARIWKGAKRALEKKLANVRFLRIYVDHLHEYFAPGEVDELWITFPDPYLKKTKQSKRLTSAKFLRIYEKVLRPGGYINLKTDSTVLFEFTKQVVSRYGCPVHRLVDDIYGECPEDDVLTVKTYYEKGHLEKGKTIHFISFSLPEGGVGQKGEA